MQVLAKISQEVLSIEDAVEFVQESSNGCANLFIGKVRNNNLGREVLGVSYDAFEPLCINTLTEIANEAINEFDHHLKIYISHFKGKLEIGGISVVIAIGSPHRDASFIACRYIIEELKKRAPIWKKEHYLDGDDEWLLGHELIRAV